MISDDTAAARERQLIAAHQRRLGLEPWLYLQAPPHVEAWARPWQREVQAQLCAVERVQLGEGCFVAPDALIVAEPGREVRAGDRCTFASRCVVRGPVQLGDDVGVNVDAHLEGGAGGLVIGTGARIAAGCTIYAWNHGFAAGRPIREQRVTSRGIVIGADVWLGARVGVTDGVTIGDGTVVGMGSVVTRDLPPGVIAAGNPARVLRPRT